MLLATVAKPGFVGQEGLGGGEVLFKSWSASLRLGSGQFTVTAGGRGVYLVQQAKAAAADCRLTGCRFVCSSHGVLESRSGGSAQPAGELKRRPRPRANAINFCFIWAVLWDGSGQRTPLRAKCLPAARSVRHSRTCQHAGAALTCRVERKPALTKTHVD